MIVLFLGIILIVVGVYFLIESYKEEQAEIVFEKIIDEISRAVAEIKKENNKVIKKKQVKKSKVVRRKK